MCSIQLLLEEAVHGGDEGLGFRVKGGIPGIM